MNRNKYIATTVALLLSIAAFAQDEIDALRYSITSPMGTARSMGFGGALGSIGADFTSISVNPAGIGLYRKSEFMFTPSIRTGKASATYLQNTVDDNATRLTLNNIGIVFTRAERGKRYDKSNWKAASFAFGVNRIADFNRGYTYSGLMKGGGNDHSSFSELFVADANGNSANTTNAGSLAYLGYQSYLVNFDSASNSYYTLANWQTGLNQTRNVVEHGGINELAFAVGGNYQEHFMIGATLGVPILRYTRDAYFEETDASGNANNDFAAFRYTENLQTNGLGINVKLGMIFKPSDYFRVGLALHTPTWYSLSDVYNESVTANTEGFSGINTAKNPENQFDYRLTTPWKGVLSASVLMGKYGFITADYEYVDYASIRYNFNSQYKNQESVRNANIKTAYQAASNLRVGIEARMNTFFLRGGFGYFGSPYKNSINNTNRLDFSGGIGFRGAKFFADIAFVHSVYDQYVTPYSLPAPVTTPTAKLANQMNNIAFTLGVKM